MPSPRRRRDESDYEDPSDQSLMRRAAKNPWVDGLIRIAIVIATASGAGYVSNEHANVQDAVAYEKAARAEQELVAFKKLYFERQRAATEKQDKEREEMLHRLTVIEMRVEFLRGR